ncbi:MAG: DNA methyltransferase, partial [Pseudomonadota bacterium]
MFEGGIKAPDRVNARLGTLFQAMAQGGDFGVETIDWFNGGLFDDASVLTLEADEIKALAELARLDWSAIEPSIFGTLFERGLDPDKRSQLGAHFTDPQSILRIINPVIVEPLRAEWETAKAIIEADKSKKRQKANAAYQGFLERLRNFRVLDPACGSGNFLYLALRTLKDIEHQATLEAEALGLLRQFPAVGPDVVHGIEINPYAAELARVTVWIGDIQWMLNHGFSLLRNPILRPLDTIEQRDALINPDGTEAVWPMADVIIGNPPFLGDKKMLGELGVEYVTRLRGLHKGRVPGGADLVTYWFEKARAQIESNKAKRAGLVATNSIRGGANRKVLEHILRTSKPFNNGETHVSHHIRYPGTDRIPQESGDPRESSRGGGASHCQSPGRAGDESPSGDGIGPPSRRHGHVAGRPVSHEMDDGGHPGGSAIAGHEDLLLTPLSIFHAWSDEPWINEGAAVRVSLVCFGNAETPFMLDGQPVAAIYTDLTGQAVNNDAGGDLTQAKPITENAGVSFQGPVLVGPFDVEGDVAHDWLKLPNPHGRPNSNVLRPLTNGKDITSRTRGLWVVDFSAMVEADASLYERPFEHVRQHVKPLRESNPRRNRREKWWIHGETGVGWRKATIDLSRYIATSQVSKHRFFVWLSTAVWPHQTVITIPRSDNATFGVLHSRFHELWSLGLCTSLEDRPRYTPTTTFETFPFPEGILHDPNPDTRFPAIAAAARRLNELRENWLNPPEWVERVPEVVPSYPDRILSKPGFEAELKKRTLTNLYNQRPAWL